MTQAALVPEFICASFEKSLAFYTTVLGFHVRYSRPAERFAYLEREGAELMIEQPNAHDRLFPQVELDYPFGRGVNLQIIVSDVLSLHAKVKEAGHNFFLPLERRWYRRSIDSIEVCQFAVQDPDGYLLRFSEILGTRPIDAA